MKNILQMYQVNKYIVFNGLLLYSSSMMSNLRYKPIKFYIKKIIKTRVFIFP